MTYTGDNEGQLKTLAAVARQYHLTVWQWKPGPVGVHSSGSYHYLTFPDGVGRAFDAYGTWLNMQRYAWHLRRNYREWLSEGIHNCGIPGLNLSVKFGINVPGVPFWGQQTWDIHRNHVHVAS